MSVNPRLVATGAAGLAAAVTLATPMVMRWEGRELDPYIDLAGVKTVCFGETANVQQRRYTPAECDAMLGRSLLKHARPVLACLPPTAPTGVKAAFVSFSYNVGAAGACGSKAAEFANLGDYRAACQALMSWNKVKQPRFGEWRCAPAKRVISSKGERYCITDGLTNRRAAERDMCLSGLR